MIDHLGDASFWETVAKLAPIATALIALAAASIALYSIGVQRDVARRRAAIDFFLKTETDDKLIDLYELFKDLKPDLMAIATLQQYETFKESKEDCKKARAFLNLLELIAVGINQKAFSDTVSYDYWGDVLLGGWKASQSWVGFVRGDASEGTSDTYRDLEKVYLIWKKRDDETRRRQRR